MKVKEGGARRELEKTDYTARPWKSDPKFKRNALICQEEKSSNAS